MVKDWEQRKLKDILIVNSGRDYKHLSFGTIPVFGTGGYMLSVNDKLSDRDGIGLGRKGTINKPQYLNAPFWTVDTLFYLTSKENNSLLFQYYVTQSINWLKFDESTGVPSLSKKTIESINKYIPSYDEQIKNGEFFKKIDRTIELHQRKINILIKIKQEYLDLKFPKNSINSPNIHFKYFLNTWRKKKFNELLETQPNSKYLATVESVGKYMVIQQGNQPVIGYANGEPFKDYKNITLFGDHTASIYKPNQPFFVATDGVKILRVDKMNGDFLYTLLEKYKPITQGYKRHFSILKQSICYLPDNKEEQVKIGLFFKKNEKIIALHQRKLDTLVQTKQEYLNKMFI